jgi:hypothetical protein
MSTLPTDSAERKKYPMFRGLIRYFPAALAGVAKHSYEGNEKHNPGEEMHHARGKSTDHADCIVRHLVDLDALESKVLTPKGVQDLLTEANALAWRALALSQQIHEQYGDAPLAPGARLPGVTEEQIRDVIAAIDAAVPADGLGMTINGEPAEHYTRPATPSIEEYFAAKKGAP